MLGPLPFRLFMNPRCDETTAPVLDDAGFRQAKTEITSWAGYAVTPMHDLPKLARQAGLGAIRLKDEATRFGLGSFKALGGPYAVARLVAGHKRRITVTCATDGNHGRAVAWAAQRFDCDCVIFVHARVSENRVDAIRRYGARVCRVSGTYDDALHEAARRAEAHGWFVVSDTSWPGYTEIPRQIMQGYRLMADETAAQWSGEPPTHVFIQGGVGGVAAAVAIQIRARAPALIVVEPEHAACLLASAELGQPASLAGDLDTLMAGLACGEPSLVAWQVLDHAAAAFMAIPDEAAVECMRLLAGCGIVGGESGVAGLAGCLLVAAEPAARETLGLDAASRVLLFNTEGATDLAMFEQLTGMSPATVARRRE